MKEDVETLPEKEEVIVEVELTLEQRRYYKAIYSQQVSNRQKDPILVDDFQARFA
jgi:SNF2 family DNA or RNA helicase